jgi:transcription elongation factor Elf1
MLTRQKNEEVMAIAKKIKCPVCNNKRLLDLVVAKDGEVMIKCPKCRRIIDVTFQDNRIKAKAM